MKTYHLFCGIDVSKASLDFWLTDATNPATTTDEHFALPNDAAGLRRLFALLVKRRIDLTRVLFCLEDTGCYALPLCAALQVKGADYAVVPAIHIQRSIGLRRGKTDKTDARHIAAYARTHAPHIALYQLPEPDLQQLKLLLTERDKLLKALSAFQASAEAFAFMDGKLLRVIKKHNAATVALLRKQLKALEESVLTLVAHNEQMSRQAALLQSIPGIGPQTALQLITYSRCFSSFRNWRQMACYAGVAPFPHQSGSSVRGRTKVSHYAQKKLKALLNMSGPVGQTPRSGAASLLRAQGGRREKQNAGDQRDPMQAAGTGLCRHRPPNALRQTQPVRRLNLKNTCLAS